MKNDLTDIHFVDYLYTGADDIQWTMFLFYLDGIWDEDKSTLEEGLKKYPPAKYNWLHIEEVSDGL